MKPKLKLRRYHYSVYFPNNTSEMISEFISQLSGDPKLTTHAVESLHDHKCGLIPLPTFDELFDRRNTVVEIYERLNESNQRENIAQKLAIRVPHLDPKGLYDYTYVIARENFIVTAWGNDKNDEHRLTESFDRYYRPKKWSKNGSG